MVDPRTRLDAALQGRYRVERELGEGGMATVWLAEDLRHGRKVALKVLKAELTAALGAERFLTEIETTAGLHHPHILPLFDSGQADDLLFYVMPHVEGGSLKDRLDREGQLPVADALRITTAVAHALDYAHRRGVIHRDIKPSNILVHEGEPVLADFGIARALGTGGQARLTETGTSLGTPHYMSPEQATGATNVGGATDVFALGCVLYEMLVGEPPYDGGTPQAILAKIITAEPVSVTAERKSVPANVDSVVRRALEKLPADRFATAGDLARALGDPAYRYGDGTPADVGQTPGPWRWIAMALGASTVALAVVVAWSLSAIGRAAPRPLARFDITPPPSQRLAGAPGVLAAVAPDGAWIVYVGEAAGGGTQLWRRDLAELEATPLRGTEGGLTPTVAPDGRGVAFLADGAIRTVSLDGGLPVTVATDGVSPSWGEDGMIYFVRDEVTYRVGETGGEPVPFTEHSVNGAQYHPHALPEARGILVTVCRGTPAQCRIGVAGPEGGIPSEILTGTMARYATTGHIVYATAPGTLMAAPFDLRRLEVTGPSLPLVAGIGVASTSTSQFALSASGTLVYGTGAGFASELVWVDRSGRIEPLDSSWTGEFGSPSLSPDGRRVAVAIQGSTSMDIWVKDLGGGAATRLTLDGGRNDYPVWTPDGASVTFTSDRASPSFDLWTKRADGVGEPVLEVDEEGAVAEALWSPDGAWFLHRTSTLVEGAGDIVAQHRAVGADPVPLVAGRATEVTPTLSPDGRWLAYTSTETGGPEVFVVPFPNSSDAKWRVSGERGTEPRWSRDGRELFYRNGNGAMMAARVRTGATFSVESTTVLFRDADYPRNFARHQYDVTADGARFLMVRPLGIGMESRLILVQNFSEELRRIGGG